MFNRIAAIIAIIISIATLVLTSPLIIEHYISPKLVYKASQLSNGALKLEFKNEGRRGAKNVRIEIADRNRGTLMPINDITVIPPKKYKLSNQWVFQIIDFEDPFLKDEEVYVSIKSDLPNESYPYLWIRVTDENGAVPFENFKLIADE